MGADFVVFKADTNPVRLVHHNGRKVMVVPTMAIREGVLNGELVLAEEFGKYLEAWNGIPIPLGHPKDADGRYVSANTPDIVAQCPGRFYFARLDGGDRLAGEIWLDVELARAIGGDALTALHRLENGEAIEVSTGYFRDVEEAQGERDGLAYNGIQRNLRPDHLALLLHENGACDWQMGCGAPRVNSQAGGAMEPRVIAISMEMSLDEQMSKVYDAFQDAFVRPVNPEMRPTMYIREIYSDRVIAKMDDKLYAIPFEMDGEGSITFGDPTEVHIVYEPVGNAGQPAANAETTPCPMAGNCPHAPLPLPPSEDGQGEGQTPAAESAAAPEGEALPAANAQPGEADDPGMAEIESLIHEAGGVEAARTALQAIKDNAARERAGLVSGLLANANCTFTEPELQAMSIEQLKKFSDALRPADYSGRGAPRANQAEALIESPMPSYLG